MRTTIGQLVSELVDEYERHQAGLAPPRLTDVTDAYLEALGLRGAAA